MKKILVLAALATAIVSAPALAQDHPMMHRDMAMSHHAAMHHRMMMRERMMHRHYHHRMMHHMIHHDM